MNEELRLIPPVVNIPKSTLENSPQPLNIDGKEYIVPGGTYINLCTVAVHRNPKYWPHGPPRSEEEGGRVHSTSNVDNDLEEFRPERWFTDEDEKSQEAEKHQKNNDGTGVDETPDTATTMFRPPKGAYIPFSEGYRACLGRRFAQVEILATIAVIFQGHSIELCTEDWANEEEVRRMEPEEKIRTWNKAKDEAERKIREEMGTVITLQMRGKGVKVRVCKKGDEIFNF
jgi:cytochrome P450